MTTDDTRTYLVRLPKAFPLARLACIASEYGYLFRWKQARNPAYGNYEVVNEETPEGVPEFSCLEQEIEAI